MRRGQEVVEADQRIVRRGFGGEHVEGAGAQAVGPKLRRQRRFVDDRPARGVDQDRTRRHAGQFGCADQAACAVIEGQVDGDDGASFQKIFEACHFDTDLRAETLIGDDVVGQDAAAERAQ